MKTKASASKKSRRGSARNAGRKQPKRRPAGKSRRSRSQPSRKPSTDAAIIPSLVEEAPITARPAEPFVDKRDDELTDEESLDREERQELY